MILDTNAYGRGYGSLTWIFHMKQLHHFAFLLIAALPIHAQTVPPRFSPHLHNYILFDDIDEIKFQLSLKYQLLKGGWSEMGARMTRGLVSEENLERLYFTYTQTSFWDIGEPSAPFSDHSFKPGMLCRLPSPWTDHVDLGYEHESNGRDGESSRGWDRVYAKSTLTYRDFDLGLKGWLVIDEGRQNQDIRAFQGNGELSLDWHSNRDAVDEDIRIGVAARVGSGGDRGNTKVELQVPAAQLIELLPFVERSIVNPHILAQYWDGYGEQLLEYNRYDRVFRIGFAFPFGP